MHGICCRPKRPAPVQSVAAAWLLSMAGAAGAWAGANEVEITALKDLCLTTVLVRDRTPAAVLVTPAGPAYAQAVESIQAAVERGAGVRLPVLDAAQAADAAAVLRDRHVIALGNMATNPFLLDLYFRWYCLLDLKYPGPGGYAIRSLHNPFGTKRNAVLIGGSDDTGVLEAAKVFAASLKPANPLAVGWLMETRLGAGVTPTKRSWRNESGTAPSGAERKGGEFGWNPISRAAGLYYMTGEKPYLDEFLALARPDPDHIPEVLLRDGAFHNPKNALVETYEYHDHLLDCVWDLIEESPILTDADRLYVTRKLLDHQLWRQPGYGGGTDPDNFLAHTPGRHEAYMILGIYTGSRYFANSYPHPKWERRLASVRQSFHTFIERADWPIDTLYFMGNCIQYIFDFYSLDGHAEFVASGAARGYMDILDLLRTGKEKDEGNQSITPFQMNMATWMLRDGRYAWQARQVFAPADLEKRFLDRSFWPPPELAIAPATDNVGRVLVHPPTAGAGPTGTNGAPTFHMLAYRGGHGPQDDYFALDGYYGRGRTPYHINTILNLRLFGGVELLAGYENGLQVWHNGGVDLVVPVRARLVESAAGAGAALVVTELPDTTASTWTRVLAYRQGDGFVVADRIAARAAGEFTVQRSWGLACDGEAAAGAPAVVTLGKDVIMSLTGAAAVSAGKRTVSETRSAPLAPGGALGLVAAFARADAGEATPWGEVQPDLFVAGGPGGGVVALAPVSVGALAVDARFLWGGPRHLMLAGATRLAVGGRDVLRTDRPVAALWDGASGTLMLEAKAPVQLTLAAGNGPTTRALAAGRHTLTDAGWPPAWKAAIADLSRGARSANAAAANGKAAADDTAAAPAWTPRWQATLGAPVTHLDAAGGAPWAVLQGEKSARVVRLSPAGQPAATAACDSEVLSFWAARTPAQRQSFSVLVGCDDDTVRALGEDGRERWRFQAEVDPSFRVGTRWQAPWFSDPAQHHGVYTLLVDDIWGKGTEQIALGRAVTVEIHALDGRLAARVPCKWGFMVGLAALKRPGQAGRGPLLVATRYSAHVDATAIRADYGVYGGHGLFGAGKVVPGCTGMHAWGRQGIQHVVADDLDGDGTDEVVMTYTGHWNELRVWDGGDPRAVWEQTPRWMRYYGPADGNWTGPHHRPRSFMRALQVVDLDGDGRKEILVGLRSGWVYAYDAAGRELWHRRFEPGVRDMIATPGGRVAVGLADGRLVLLDGRGQVLRADELGAAVNRLAVLNGSGLVAGTQDGVVAGFEMK